MLQGQTSRHRAGVRRKRSSCRRSYASERRSWRWTRRIRKQPPRGDILCPSMQRCPATSGCADKPCRIDALAHVCRRHSRKAPEREGQTYCRCTVQASRGDFTRHNEGHRSTRRATVPPRQNHDHDRRRIDAAWTAHLPLAGAMAVQHDWRAKRTARCSATWASRRPDLIGRWQTCEPALDVDVASSYSRVASSRVDLVRHKIGARRGGRFAGQPSSSPYLASSTLMPRPPPLRATRSAVPGKTSGLALVFPSSPQAPTTSQSPPWNPPRST
jgi:hypothetical protein